MIEFTLFCLGIIIMAIFIMAMILDYKLKQHEKKEFYKNLNRKKSNIPIYELRGQGVTLLHDTPKPKGIYEPVYYIRKEIGKAAFGINDVRSFVYPIGGISKKIIADKSRNI